LEEAQVDWQRLAGAQVLQIDGRDPYDFVDTIADTISGNFLDHGVRVNSVFTSYGFNVSYTQRFGDFASQVMSGTESVTLTVIPVNATEAETVTVTVPFVASYTGSAFTDAES